MESPMNTQVAENNIGIADEEMVLSSPLGAELSRAQAAALADKVAVLCMKDGDFLLEEGHSDSVLYVIVSGKLEVTKSVGGAEYVTLQLLHTGDMAGELGFIDGLEHSAGLRAVGNCVVYSLSRENLESFLKTDPELTYKVMRAITRTVHGILRRMNIQHVEMQNYITKQHGRY